MGDVGERPTVDERRIMFESLHQVGRDSVLQQHRHGSRSQHGLCPNRLAVAGKSDDHATETFFEKPKVLHKKYPELYGQLARFYAVDPLDWD